MMNDFPGSAKADPLTLFDCQGVIGRFECEGWTKSFAVKMRHGLEVQGGLRIATQFCAEPAEKWTDFRRARVLPVFVKILAFLRHPDTETEWVRIVMNGDFDHAPDEEVLVVDDAEVGGQLDAVLALFLGDIPAKFGLVGSNIRKR